MESQCLGLAEALNLIPVIKRARLRSPWKELSPYLRLGHQYAFTRSSTPLAPPWPDLLIASGRQSIAASLYVHRMSRRAGMPAVTVQVQDPAISPSRFDLVIVPAHDRLSGANVLSTVGALHRITPSKLAAAAQSLQARVAALPRPYVTVLLGGANGAYRAGGAQMRALGEGLADAIKSGGGSLLITPSRRTRPEHLPALRAAIDGLPSFVWNFEGDNPYFGMLGLADRIVVTCDSVNMICEAAATGKLVQVFDLPGGSAKFARFHAEAKARGWTHPFPGALPDHAPKPSDDMARAAAAVRATYQAIRGTPP